MVRRGLLRDQEGDFLLRQHLRALRPLSPNADNTERRDGETPRHLHRLPGGQCPTPFFPAVILLQKQVCHKYHFVNSLSHVWRTGFCAENKTVPSLRAWRSWRHGHADLWLRGLGCHLQPLWSYLSLLCPVPVMCPHRVLLCGEGVQDPIPFSHPFLDRLGGQC